MFGLNKPSIKYSVYIIFLWEKYFGKQNRLGYYLLDEKNLNNTILILLLAIKEHFF